MKFWDVDFKSNKILKYKLWAKSSKLEVSECTSVDFFSLDRTANSNEMNRVTAFSSGANQLARTAVVLAVSQLFGGWFGLCSGCPCRPCRMGQLEAADPELGHFNYLHERRVASNLYCNHPPGGNGDAFAWLMDGYYSSSCISHEDNDDVQQRQENQNTFGKMFG